MVKQNQVITIEQAVELELRACPSCGSFVALTAIQWKRRQAGDKDGYWCPNGHQYGWWETDADRHRVRAEKAEVTARELKLHNDNLLLELHTKNVLIAQSKHRALAGVCHFCHRTFQNVAKHMASKHEKHQDGT